METNDKALALYLTRFTNRLILKGKMWFLRVTTHKLWVAVQQWMTLTHLS